jgi:hypothetical protein
MASWKRTVEVDVKDEDLAKCPVGTKISMTITGTVKTARLGEKPKDMKDSDYECCGCGISRGYPSSLSIEMEKQSLKVGENQFDALAEDED